MASTWSWILLRATCNDPLSGSIRASRCSAAGVCPEDLVQRGRAHATHLPAQVISAIHSPPPRSSVSSCSTRRRIQGWSRASGVDAGAHSPRWCSPYRRALHRMRSMNMVVTCTAQGASPSYSWQ